MELRGDYFLLDGKPLKVISGSIHYFRVVPEYWRDRLEKLRAMGCNTVETYVPWNLHEPERGRFDFSGRLDIASFIAIAGELGLHAIVRPSPYICAEHEFGGLPSWLLAEDGLRLRCGSGPFVERVRPYWKKLFKILAPLQVTRGGPVILFQLENEYGGYGNETAYLESLHRLMVAGGMEVPCITSDGPWNSNLDNGALTGPRGAPGTPNAAPSVPLALPTVNFGSRAEAQMAVLDDLFARRGISGPRMVTEFWAGWFDSWGCGGHHVTDAQEQADNLDFILSRGSVNIYMFHGGTSFGFTNGSNYYDALTPDVTSYDYDAPLAEDGSITAKYLAFRSVISKYAPVSELKFSAHIERRAYGEIVCAGKVSLFAVADSLAEPVFSPVPLSMEKLGQDYGYTLYRASVPDGAHTGRVAIKTMRLVGANDRAQVFLNGERKATWYDRELLENHEVDWTAAAPCALDILAENMGRVNFGPFLESQRKGIAGIVRVNDHGINGWAHYRLPLTNTERIDWTKPFAPGVPAFYRFAFTVDRAGDTFLDTTGWGKGCAILNGFNLGRFWSIGPQKRLYVPAPLLRKGVNELVIFETEGIAGEKIVFADGPDLGPVLP